MSTKLPSMAISIALLAGLILTACRGAEGPLSITDLRDITVARAKWTQMRPAHYRYESTVSCFCPFEYAQAIVAEVRNGVVVDTRYPDGRPYSYPTMPRLPIDSLFVQLLEPGENVERVEATFDDRYGYPKQFSITLKPEIADGFYGVTITRFEPLP